MFTYQTYTCPKTKHTFTKMSMNVVYQLKYVGQGQCVFYAK